MDRAPITRNCIDMIELSSENIVILTNDHNTCSVTTDQITMTTVLRVERLAVQRCVVCFNAVYDYLNHTSNDWHAGNRYGAHATLLSISLMVKPSCRQRISTMFSWGAFPATTKWNTDPGTYWIVLAGESRFSWSSSSISRRKAS